MSEILLFDKIYQKFLDLKLGNISKGVIPPKVFKFVEGILKRFFFKFVEGILKKFLPALWRLLKYELSPYLGRFNPIEKYKCHFDVSKYRLLEVEIAVNKCHGRNGSTLPDGTWVEYSTIHSNNEKTIYISSYIKSRAIAAKDKIEKFLEDHYVPMIHEFTDKGETLELLVDTSYKELLLAHWREKVALISKTADFKACNISFIFTGKPGAGKTTFVRHLAIQLYRSVYISPSLNDIKKIKENAIIFFDDFDKDDSKYNLAQLLSILDGIGKKTRHILIFNVNDVNFIESTFKTMIRPGRSRVLEFPMPTLEELERYRDLFCSPTIKVAEGDTFAAVYERFIDEKVDLLLNKK